MLDWRDLAVAIGVELLELVEGLDLRHVHHVVNVDAVACRLKAGVDVHAEQIGRVVRAGHRRPYRREEYDGKSCCSPTSQHACHTTVPSLSR